MQPTAQDIDQLRVFPFLSDPTILASLKVELPSYLAKQQISVLIFILLSGGVDMSKIYHNGHLLPRKLQPSSAAAEYFRYWTVHLVNNSKTVLHIINNDIVRLFQDDF